MRIIKFIWLLKIQEKFALFTIIIIVLKKILKDIPLTSNQIDTSEQIFASVKNNENHKLSSVENTEQIIQSLFGDAGKLANEILTYDEEYGDVFE